MHKFYDKKLEIHCQTSNFKRNRYGLPKNIFFNYTGHERQLELEAESKNYTLKRKKNLEEKKTSARGKVEENSNKKKLVKKQLLSTLQVHSVSL